MIAGAGAGTDLAGHDSAANIAPGVSVSVGAGARQALTRSYNPLIMKLARLPVPIVSAVGGAAAGPTVALGLMRQGLSAALESDYATALAAEAERQAIAGESVDATEGAASFLQKRTPVFGGR